MAQYLNCHRNSQKIVNIRPVPLVCPSRRLKVNISNMNKLNGVYVYRQTQLYFLVVCLLY